jgi:hypothetical protein
MRSLRTTKETPTFGNRRSAKRSRHRLVRWQLDHPRTPSASPSNRTPRDPSAQPDGSLPENPTHSFRVTPQRSDLCGPACDTSHSGFVEIRSTARDPGTRCCCSLIVMESEMENTPVDDAHGALGSQSGHGTGVSHWEWYNDPG